MRTAAARVGAKVECSSKSMKGHSGILAKVEPTMGKKVMIEFKNDSGETYRHYAYRNQVRCARG